MTNSLTNVSIAQLQRAIAIKERIETLDGELASVLGAAPKKRTMSAAGRARVAAAQRARWAKVHRKTTGKSAGKPRRKMSAAARKRLSRLAKARWAKAHAAGKTRL
jgi:hypothetical protein